MDLQLTKYEKADVRFIQLDVYISPPEEVISIYPVSPDKPLKEQIKESLKNCFKDNIFSATIDLQEERIIGWPIGLSMKINNAKVTDRGNYQLLDANKNLIKEFSNSYVPNKLLPGEDGDYLNLDVDENGIIRNWLKSANLLDFENKNDLN